MVKKQLLKKSAILHQMATPLKVNNFFIKRAFKKYKMPQFLGGILYRKNLFAQRALFRRMLKKRFRYFAYVFRKKKFRQKLRHWKSNRKTFIGSKPGFRVLCYWNLIGRPKPTPLLSKKYAYLRFRLRRRFSVSRRFKIVALKRRKGRKRKKKRRWRVYPKKSRRLRKRKRYKIFFSRKYFFKKVSRQFFNRPFVNWQVKFAKKLKQLKLYWKIFDISLRKYYFYNIQPKESSGLWNYNQAARFDKILSFRQALVLRVDNLLVLSKFVPNLRTATLMVQRGFVYVNELVASKHQSLASSDTFYVLPHVVYNIIKWSIFVRQALKYRNWKKRSWWRMKVHPLVSRSKYLYYVKNNMRPWIFKTEEGSSYSAVQLLKITSNKYDLWFKMNPWVWNLSFFSVPPFLEISVKFLLGVVFRWPFSYEIVPFSRFSDRVIRRYVRKFINTNMLRPKKYEVWTKFRTKLKNN